MKMPVTIWPSDEAEACATVAGETFTNEKGTGCIRHGRGAQQQ